MGFPPCLLSWLSPLMMLSHQEITQCQVWQEILLPPPWEPNPSSFSMSLAKKTCSGQLQHLQPGHCPWLSLALWPALGNLHIQTTMARAPPSLSLQSMTPLAVLGGFLCLQLRDDDPLGAGGEWYLMMVMSSGKEGRWFSS